MTREQRDPYVVLGVGRQASPAEIAHAYRRAARETHPDSSQGGAVSGEGFRAVSEAYETLRDPGRRLAYDRAHPLVRRRDPASPPARLRSVGYASPDGQHILLGVSLHVPPIVRAGRVEVVPPAPASLLRRHADDGAAPLALFVRLLLRSRG